MRISMSCLAVMILACACARADLSVPQSAPTELQVSAAERKHTIVAGIAIAVSLGLGGLLLVRLRRSKTK